MLASKNVGFAAAGETALRISRKVLVGILGDPTSSWFIDSSVNGFQVHFKWACGCTAYRGETDELCVYRPCAPHSTPEST